MDDSGHGTVHCPEFNRQLSPLPSCQPNVFHSLDDRPLISMAYRPDFNFPNKIRGHLVHAETSFQFVGPDRDLVQTDSVQKCLEVADIIMDTGLIKLQDGSYSYQVGFTQLRAWEHYLRDYPDQRLLQYLTFGFPLSVQKDNTLTGRHIENHFSARQFPNKVASYLHKEIKERAIVGPVSYIDHPAFHCSPLLTRPKDGDKHRVIIDLSYPKGNAVNDFVNRDAFDGTEFTLRFPTIDDIANDIIGCIDDPVRFNVDIACAFHNLCVDPADSLKFGVQWQGKLYLDIAVAFG